jgi:hypothetical protein
VPPESGHGAPRGKNPPHSASESPDDGPKAVGAQDEPVTSSSSISDLQPAGSPATQMAMGAPAVSVVCVLSPKVKHGALALHEYTSPTRRR